MFYSQDILQKRGGRFGIIWIAATRAVQLSRRDYSSVQIRRTCEEIIQYITQQQMPDEHGRRPRFSLYLSSQLMYGVCRVFRKQHEYLNGDVTALWLKCTSSFVSTASIDLQMKRTYETTWPSPLTTHRRDLTSLEFGNFRTYSEVELQLLPDLEYWTYEEGLYDSHGSISPDALINKPDIPLPQVSPQIPSDLRFPTIPDSPLQVSKRNITMQESEERLPRSKDVEVPGEMDLPPIPTDFYQLSAEEKDLSTTLSETELGAGQAADARIPTTEETMAMSHEGLLAPTEETPAVLIDPDQLDLLARPQPQLPHVPDVTPVPTVPEPRTHKRKRIRLQLLPVEEPLDTPRKKRARRHLLIDPTIQISHRQFRDQISSGSQTSRDQVEIWDPNYRQVSGLFKEPHSQAIKNNTLFRELWNRNLRSSSVPTTEEEKESAWTVPTESSSSDNDSPRLELQPLGDVSLEDMVGGVPATEQPSIDSAIEAIREASVSHIELPRDASRSHLDATGLQITPGHPSFLSRSHDSSLLTSFDTESASKSRRRFSDSLHESVQQEPIMESYIEEFPLYQIPEGLEMPALNQETPGVQPTPKAPAPSQPSQPKVSRVEEEAPAVPEAEQLPAHHRLMREIKKYTKDGHSTAFHVVCPFTTPRMQAATLFSALLDICALQRTVASQDEPYDEIIIERGPKW